LIAGAWELEPGDFIEVEITGSDAHDLSAIPVEVQDQDVPCEAEIKRGQA